MLLLRYRFYKINLNYLLKIQIHQTRLQVGIHVPLKQRLHATVPEVIVSVKNLRETKSSLLNIITTPGYIIKIVSKHGKNKIPDIDLIANKVLILFPKNSILILTKIFNDCLGNSYFPSILKTASIITILKLRKDHQLTTTYKYIALLSLFSKTIYNI